MAKSLSKVLRSEDLGDCQEWQELELRPSGESSQVLTARQLEEIHNQARQEGYQEGLKQGREAGLQAMHEQTQILKKVMFALEKPIEELDESVELQVTELAMMVARHLVRRELKMDPEQVVGVVKEALSALPIATRDIRLELNPEDATLIREALSLDQSGKNIQIVDSPVLSRGGCRVLTESSQIDASVESRLNAVIANVLGGSRHADKE